MSRLEAGQFGRRKAMSATAVVFAFLFLMLLLDKREAILNIHVLIVLIILFTLTFIFGGMAGREMIIERSNMLIVTFKYVIILSVAIAVYGVFFSYTYFLSLFVRSVIPLIFPWLWATWKMRKMQKSQQNILT